LEKELNQEIICSLDVIESSLAATY